LLRREIRWGDSSRNKILLRKYSGEAKINKKQQKKTKKEYRKLMKDWSIRCRNISNMPMLLI